MATSIINKGRLPYFYDAYKTTRASADTVTLQTVNNENRYLALLFIVQNSGNSAIYAVNYKTNVYAVAEKLFGGNINVSVDVQTGSIGVGLGAWSEVYCLSVVPFE